MGIGISDRVETPILYHYREEIKQTGMKRLIMTPPKTAGHSPINIISVL